MVGAEAGSDFKSHISEGRRIVTNLSATLPRPGMKAEMVRAKIIKMFSANSLSCVVPRNRGTPLR